MLISPQTLRGLTQHIPINLHQADTWFVSLPLLHLFYPDTQQTCKLFTRALTKAAVEERACGAQSQ